MNALIDNRCIYVSFEVNCMSRDLSYDDYIFYHTKYNYAHTPLTKEKYEAIDNILFDMDV